MTALELVSDDGTDGDPGPDPTKPLPDEPGDENSTVVDRPAFKTVADIPFAEGVEIPPPLSKADQALLDRAAEAGKQASAAAEDPGSFDARVTATRVDLIARMRDGIPPIDYLPASEGMLIRGKRHQIPAPKKSGKSLSMLVHWATMVQAGSRVVILDRENGANLYAARLQEIVNTLDLDPAAMAERLDYYEFPRLKSFDGEDLAALCADADVVVFDSQRMFLTDLGLGEDGSDDYSKFAAAAVEPLFFAGIATVILDNTGHTETKRGRGSAAKGDLNEVLFSLEAVDRFGINHTGRVRLTITDSRFGTEGAWEMAIGGGVFEPWKKADEEGDGWEPTILMQRVIDHLAAQAEPVSRTSVANEVVGNRSYLFQALDTLVRKGTVTASEGNRVSITVPDSSSAVPEPARDGAVPWFPVPSTEPRNRPIGEPKTDAETERLAALGEELGLT